MEAQLQPYLFDERNLISLTSENYPGERLDPMRGRASDHGHPAVRQFWSPVIVGHLADWGCRADTRRPDCKTPCRSCPLCSASRFFRGLARLQSEEGARLTRGGAFHRRSGPVLHCQ